MNKTIYALSSASGRAGVSIIRVSGDNLLNVFTKMVHIKSPKPRHAYFANYYDHETDEILDNVVAIYFSAPNSFTGQDIIEIHCHGSLAVINKILTSMGKMAGFSAACPGDFARRAFMNNKMDLTQVDGLIDLINAQTEHQRRAALSNLDGALQKLYLKWRTDMVALSALMTASIDFSDDELPENISNNINDRLDDLIESINKHLNTYAIGSAIQHGFNIALIGSVNAGKSSLFNCLLGHDRSIISDIPGTTRDVVDATLDLDGYLVTISDTAGLRETTDEIESIGIERTHKTRYNAHLKIYVVSADEEPNPKFLDDDTIVVYTKSDLYGNDKPNSISTICNDGMPGFIELLKRAVHERLDTTDSTLVSNDRVKKLLTECVSELELAKRQNISDLRAEHIRRATDALGQILGLITFDEVLNSVFSQLCLGK